MRGKKVEGVVSILCIVNAEGRVQDPRIENSNHHAFDKPALDAIKQWKFEAAVKGGKRVPCRIRVPLRFQPS
jgi:protein TonB